MVARSNPRTKRLSDIVGKEAGTFRLSQADRDFLRDLSRVSFVSSDQAAKHHYAHLKTGGVRSLKRLEENNIIISRRVHVTGRPVVTVYEFYNQDVAKAWGGRLPKTGPSRSDFHELITSDVYFNLGRPDDFRLPFNFTKQEKSQFISGKNKNGQPATFGIPDAMYTDRETGEVVVVEADAGNYNSQQIAKKMQFWHVRGFRQLWAQPKKTTAKVRPGKGVVVLEA